MAEGAASAADADLLIERDAGIGWLILNRPRKRNALTVGMQASMDAFLAAAATDDGIRAVVLAARGEKTFSAGGDFSETSETMPEEAYRRERSRQMFRTCVSFMDFPKPLVVALNGLSIGSGCILTLLADARIATEAGGFSLPEILRGRPTFAGAAVVSRMMGDATALDLVQSGRAMMAEEGMRRGIVQAIVPASELKVKTAEHALALAGHGGSAFGLHKQWVHRETKRLLREAEEASLALTTPLVPLVKQNGER